MLKSFAGGKLFGATWGSTPATVLALHGWRRSHADFDGVAAAVPSVGALGPDLFGFGATPPPPEPWGSLEYAQALVELLEEPDSLADRVVVVGHSFGGRVGLLLAQLVPDRIERLVLTGVPLLERIDRRSRVAVRYRVGRRLHRWGLLGETRMEGLRQRYGSPDYRAARGIMREVFVRVLHEDYREAMANTACQVQLVWGAEDTEAPLEVAERAADLFPAATLTVLPGVGHLVPTEDPTALARFLAPAPDDAPDAPASSSPPDRPRDAQSRAAR